jgi:hypothetical protein
VKTERIVSAVLVLFVVVSVGYLVVSESSPGRGADQLRPETSRPEGQVSVGRTGVPGEARGEKEVPHKLVAYYFHRQARCRTCLAMEAYAREALEGAFPDALESGELEWHAVNLDRTESEHFVREYNLTSSALVLVNWEQGQRREWRDLKEIWHLVRDEQAFKAYVEAEARAYLESAS